MDDDNDPVTDNIQTHRLSNTPQHTSLGVQMVLIIEKHRENITTRIGCLDLVNNKSEVSLTSQPFSSISLDYTLRWYYSHI